MRSISRVLGILFLILGGTWGAFAHAGSLPQIQIVEPKIDYPASGVTGTAPYDINDLGNLSIIVNLSDGSVWVGGRINGQYTDLSQPPGTVLTAGSYDINNFNVVIGTWYNGSKFRGFALDSGQYSVFDVNVPGATFTVPYDINDYGTFSGYYGAPNPSPHDQGFRQIGPKELDLNVPGAVATVAQATNDLLRTVGYFSTSDPSLTDATCCEAAIWDAAGRATTFAVPGNSVASTIGLGINNTGWVCGRYHDTHGVTHAFAYQTYSQQFVTYDYPGATATTFNGINDFNYIAGRYTDSSNVEHGFIARIVGGAGQR